MTWSSHLSTIIAAIGLSGCTGVLTSDGQAPQSDPSDGGPGADVSSPPARVDITGPSVQPHVQAFADAACGAVGSCTALTYEGHHPTAELALDVVVSDVLGQLPSDDNALGDALAAYALDHQEESRIWYLIWRQRINYGNGWEQMEDRGSITQNHYDHVHVSFDESP